jgi:3-hydroxybutyryl-CoA dehydratase
MPKYKRYNEVEVGDVYPPVPLTFEISGEVVDSFLASTGNTGKFYRQSSADRRAPSMIASVYLINILKARGSPPGGIHAKQSIRFHRSLLAGEVIELQAKITEKYLRKNRKYIVSDFDAHAVGGELVASGCITSIWGKDP